jgi:hypothetical protein
MYQSHGRRVSSSEEQKLRRLPGKLTHRRIAPQADHRGSLGNTLRIPPRIPLNIDQIWRFLSLIIAVDHMTNPSIEKIGKTRSFFVCV